MEIVSGIVLYLMIWWVLFFTILPWGVHPETAPIPGCTPSAPQLPRLKLKFWVTSGLSLITWLVVNWIIEHKLIRFDSL